MRRIAVDAMGGDAAPGPEIEGALQAAREREIEVILVGDEAVLRQKAGAQLAGPFRGKVVLRHASQVIAMDDQPGVAVKSKKDSSMRVCFNLASLGEADAVVSAGNSGAMLACGLFLMKRIAGVERPGILTLCPTRSGSYCVVLDVGANTELSARALVQLAVLGAAYSRILHGKARPRVAVLSNGEEETKGTDLTREAHRLLRRSMSTADARPVDFDFRGYAEGGDFFSGELDVVVTDGYTGNIALKTTEGTTRTIFAMLEAEVKKSVRAKLGALLLMPALRAMKRRFEPEEYGGAPLLGVAGVALICHGRAKGKAIKNAIFAADRLVGAGLLPALGDAIERHRSIWEEVDAPGVPPSVTRAEG